MRARPVAYRVHAATNVPPRRGGSKTVAAILLLCVGPLLWTWTACASEIGVPRPMRIAQMGICDCRLDLLRVIAAADPTGEIPAEQAAPTALSPADRVRKAGELLADGKRDQARDIVWQGIKECESNKGPLGACQEWVRSLRALNALLEESREPTVLNNSIGMKLVRIPAGEYMIGSLDREMDWLRLTFRKIWREGHKQWFQDELPLHPVRLTEGSFISASEVTVGQFREFVKATKYKTDAEREDGGMIFSVAEGRWVPDKKMKWNSTPWEIADDQPVVFVSWNDAAAFCRWLSRKEKRTYRLPTEAEWEIACRGGSVWSRYPWGNRLPGGRDTNFGDGRPKLPESLTTVDDGYKYVAPVMSYPPNGYGLYDMAGNVMEWVRDRYDRNYYASSPLENPEGPDVGTSRINKGGNWYASPADGRCAFRGFSGESMSFWNLGFRVVMEDPESAPPSTKTAEQSGSPDRDSGTNFPPSEEEGLRIFRQAVFAAQQQQWEDAVENLEKALDVYEKREDYKWIARVKATLAGIYAEQDRRFKSKELYTEALKDFRRIGDLNSARIILARLDELDTSPGVKVVKVRKGGAADKAGVVAGDIVIEYAGETGLKVDEFKRLVNDYARADRVTLSVINDDRISTFVVPGGKLDIAVEDIKRRRRPRPPDDERRGRQGERRRGGSRR